MELRIIISFLPKSNTHRVDINKSIYFLLHKLNSGI